jgi:hypothetical protein
MTEEFLFQLFSHPFLKSFDGLEAIQMSPFSRMIRYKLTATITHDAIIVDYTNHLEFSLTWS